MEITSEAAPLFHRALMIQADYQGVDHCIDLLANGYIGQERFQKMMAAARRTTPRLAGGGLKTPNTSGSKPRSGRN
jgi:hypothetical protein